MRARVVCALCVRASPPWRGVPLPGAAPHGIVCAREGGTGGFRAPTTHDGPLTNR
jgi:hypothetical protein